MSTADAEKKAQADGQTAPKPVVIPVVTQDVALEAVKAVQQQPPPELATALAKMRAELELARLKQEHAALERTARLLAERDKANEIPNLEYKQDVANRALAIAKVEAETKILMTPESAISGWFVAGMGAFGLMLGAIAGLSKLQGISGTLFAGVSTFVSTALLGYSGFKRGNVRPGGRDLDTEKLGQATVAFCLFVIVGAIGGSYLRHRTEPSNVEQKSGSEKGKPETPGPANPKASTDTKPGKVEISLEADIQKSCRGAEADLAAIDRKTDSFIAARVADLLSNCPNLGDKCSTVSANTPDALTKMDRGSKIKALNDVYVAVCK